MKNAAEAIENLSAAEGGSLDAETVARLKALGFLSLPLELVLQRVEKGLLWAWDWTETQRESVLNRLESWVGVHHQTHRLWTHFSGSLWVMTLWRCDGWRCSLSYQNHGSAPQS